MGPAIFGPGALVIGRPPGTHGAAGYYVDDRGRQAIEKSIREATCVVDDAALVVAEFAQTGEETEHRRRAHYRGRRGRRDTQPADAEATPAAGGHAAAPRHGCSPNGERQQPECSAWAVRGEHSAGQQAVVRERAKITVWPQSNL